MIPTSLQKLSLVGELHLHVHAGVNQQGDLADIGIAFAEQPNFDLFPHAQEQGVK